MNLLPRHRRGQGGKAKRPAPLPIEMLTMMKIITTKPYVFSVHFSIFAYTTNSIRVQQRNINIDDQMAWALQIKVFHLI